MWPVSYTHLDVYKRQLLLRYRNAVYCPYPEDIATFGLASSVSVAYTHLRRKRHIGNGKSRVRIAVFIYIEFFNHSYKQRRLFSFFWLPHLRRQIARPSCIRRGLFNRFR